MNRLQTNRLLCPDWLGLLVIIVIAAATVPAVLFADEPAKATRILQVWPDAPPAWTAPTEEERDKTDSKSGLVANKRVMRLGNVAKPELHLFPATATNKCETTIIVCPGGGYSILAWDLEGTEVAEWLQSIGVSAAVLKYRVPTKSEPQKWLPAVQDIQRSLGILREGIDGMGSKQIGVLGFSAGGNASARAVTAPKRFYEPIDPNDQHSFSPDFGVLIYPAWLVKDDKPKELIDDIQVSKSTPPVFFAHARDDRVDAMSSVTLFSELKKHNVASALHVFATGGHGFGLRKNNVATDHWPALCESWMRGQGWLSK